MKIRAADRERPWMGLHSFPEDSAEYFHGRRVEADELYSLCVRETLALLYGKSGLGKTSLIQAAISPRLRQNDYLPAVARLYYDREPRASLIRSFNISKILYRFPKLISCFLRNSERCGSCFTIENSRSGREPAVRCKRRF